MLLFKNKNMNKKFILSSLSIAAMIVLIVSCEKDYKQEEPISRPPVVSNSFVEEFDTVANISKKGWVITNRSNPIGGRAWRQGKYELGGKLGNEIVGFPAFSAVYSPNEFISADLATTGDGGEISCWLISPPMPAKNGDQISFYTRSTGAFPERLQVRGNYTNQSSNVGGSVKEFGDFNNLLLDINPSYGFDYPDTWTKYTLTFAGLPSALTSVRVAFRYMVDDISVNGDMIGIDRFEFISK